MKTILTLAFLVAAGSVAEARTIDAKIVNVPASPIQIDSCGASILHAHEFSTDPADRNAIKIAATFHNTQEAPLAGIAIDFQSVDAMGEKVGQIIRLERSGTYAQGVSITVNGKVPNVLGDSDFSETCTVHAVKSVDGTVSDF